MARPASNLGPEQFAAALLKRLRIPQTPGAIKAIVGWERAEGGHWHNDARYNPLNTTQNMPGSGDTGSQGNISVYRNWNQGVEATAKTLLNGRYAGILAALKAGSPNSVANAIDRSPWGTHGRLLHSAIGSTPLKSGVQAPSLGGSSASTGGRGGSSGASTRTTTTVTPGVDNSKQRALVALDFLSNKNADVLDFASQIKGLQDVAPVTQTTTIPVPGAGSADAPSSNTGPKNAGKFGRSHSPLLELIHKGGRGYAVKNGKKVNGAQFYASVWDGHADHVHVAAGPKTIVQLGRLAQDMGLHVGENPHFGGVAPVHVKDSYHYKGEAIDVSGDPGKMNEYAARVESLYGIR